MGLRAYLIIVALLGAAIAVFSLIGEVQNLGAMAHLVQYNPTPTDGHLIAAHDIMRKLYEYWYYMRFAGIVVAVLAMLAFVKAGKSGKGKP
jgi:hypothetical protein